MQTKPVYLTVGGQEKILKELEYLRDVRRREVAERIHNAGELLDGYDSPEYIDAKSEQAFVEGRILMLERILAEAVVVKDDPEDHEVVHIGSHVTVLDEDGEVEDFFIVGSPESDPRRKKISNESPVGAALMGRRAGDRLAVPVPGGVRHLTIVAIT